MAAYAASILTLLGTATMLNQTPFGPTAISQSLRTLRAGHRQPQPVPESDRKGGKNIFGLAYRFYGKVT